MKRKNPSLIKDNLRLLDYCLTHQELLADPHFSEHNPFIITDSPKKSNELMKAYNQLQDYIICYKTARAEEDEALQNRYVSKIIEVLRTENINYAEFPCFWNVLDTSYSMYCSELGEAEKKDFIRTALNLYLDRRFTAYQAHGLSPVTMQANCDTAAHKRNSSYAKLKVNNVLSEFSYRELIPVRSSKTDWLQTAKIFCESDLVYRCISSKNDRFFQAFVEFLGLKYEFLSGRKSKAPDFVIKRGAHFYIVEHKHVKEGGGGQDKQIDELIEFVSLNSGSKLVHYVSYLDGYYFNIMIKNRLISKADNPNPHKSILQLNSIKSALQANPHNYFINTAGFRELFGS